MDERILEHPAGELELCELLIPGFIGALTRGAREIPEDKWNWSFSDRTPTPREVCEHTFVWLWWDRQQVTLPRAAWKPVPDLPTERERMLDLLDEEGEEWRGLIRGLTPERLLEEREVWGAATRNVRGFLFHMAQQVVYKNGQLYMLYFGLGLDGEARYRAPHPNDVFGFSSTPEWPAPRVL